MSPMGTPQRHGRASRVVVGPGDVDRAARGLGDQVVRRHLAPRARRPEAGDIAGDDVRVGLPEGGRSRARAARASGPEVARRRHPRGRRDRGSLAAPSLAAEVERERSLVAVGRPVEGLGHRQRPVPATASPGLTILTTSAPRSASTVVAYGPGEEPGEVEHADVVERPLAPGAVLAVRHHVRPLWGTRARASAARARRTHRPRRRRRRPRCRRTTRGSSLDHRRDRVADARVDPAADGGEDASPDRGRLRNSRRRRRASARRPPEAASSRVAARRHRRS